MTQTPRPRDRRPAWLPRYPEPEDAWQQDMVHLLEERDRDVNNMTKIFELSSTFAIDSTGVVSVTFEQVFTITNSTPPDLSRVQVTVYEITEVDDWAYDWIKVTAVDSASVTVKIKLGTASGTADATAGMTIWVRP